jgi:cytochrome c oxidase subunit 2
VFQPPNLAMLWPLPFDASRHGPALDRHLILNLWIAVGLFVLAHGLLLAGSLRRRQPEPTRTGLIEYVPLAALALLFAFLTVRSERLWAASRYTGADPAALQVEVTGMQFAWYFRYPGADATFGRTGPALVDAGAGNPIGIDPTDAHGDDDFVSSELVVPTGREVDLSLQAQDVIHGFFVPAMRIKQNAVPGQAIHIHFTPTAPGTYPILCTQLCGLGHFRMAASLRVVAPAEYVAWVAAHAPETGR